MNIIGQLIIVKSEGARENASQILSIVASIEETMEILDAAVKRNIPENVETAWSDTLKSNWTSYYTGDIPETMAAMKLSASNVQSAVAAAEAYSNQE